MGAGLGRVEFTTVFDSQMQACRLLAVGQDVDQVQRRRGQRAVARAVDPSRVRIWSPRRADAAAAAPGWPMRETKTHSPCG